MKYRKIAVKEKSNNIIQKTKDSLLNELLALRNLNTEKEIEKFLNPKKTDFISPYAFLDMKKAKERIFEAIEKEQTILIWGDFDCDGVTSSAVLYKALNALKANVISFIPDRLLHGHGLNSKELLKLVSKEKVNDFAHTLDEIKTKYGKNKPDWVYKLLRIDSKVIFVETVKAKNGNEYEKLRSGIVVATKKEKEENIIYVATFYGDVRKIKEKELLYILEPGCESYRFPKDIRVFLKNQRTKKGASDIVQRFKN